MLISMVLLYFFIPATHASFPISIEKIRSLTKTQSGDVQKRFQAWLNLMENLKNKPTKVQLEKVNLFFNQFSFESDMESRQVQDYWKSPEEFIIDGGGDCEDYTIIKYASLVMLGVPEEELRITYVTSLRLNAPHMVLSYYPTPDAEPFILDNMENAILLASQRPDLKPVYSFNGLGLWLTKTKKNLLSGPNTLTKWGELMERMHNQKKVNKP